LRMSVARSITRGKSRPVLRDWQHPKLAYVNFYAVCQEYFCQPIRRGTITTSEKQNPIADLLLKPLGDLLSLIGGLALRLMTSPEPGRQ